MHRLSMGDPSNRQSSEINPLRSTLVIPENKTSLWVYQNDSTSFDHALVGVWSQSNFKLDKSSCQTGPQELWCFYDDDPLGIEESVLRNNPMQGVWGYHSSVQLRAQKRQTRPVKKPKPHEIIIIPPGDRIPPTLQVAGVWVKPIMKRDMSALADGTTGFMQVSGQIKKAEKHSIGGAWKMLGHNDQVARGRKKKNDPAGDDQGQWTMTVQTTTTTTTTSTTTSPSPSNNAPSFPISIMPGKKIADCLEKLCKEQGIPPEAKPTLYFEGKPLDPQKTILGSGIRNGDTIHLVPTTTTPTPPTTTTTTTTNPTPMEIFVRNPKGKKFKFQVQPEELVHNVKKMVEQRMAIPVEKQWLFFQQVPLTKDKAPISEYNIKHKSVLDLAEMIIFVEPLTGPTIELDVRPTETIQQIKLKVQEKGKIPVEQQRLYFKGNELTNDDATLNDCKIQHLDTLTMKSPEPPPKRQKALPARTKSMQSSTSTSTNEMIVHIVQDWDKEKFSIPVTPNLKIKELKREIYKRRNIPVKEQILTFKRKPVLNVNTLQESNIKHKSILHLEAKDDPPPAKDATPTTTRDVTHSIPPTTSEQVPPSRDVPPRKPKPIPNKTVEDKKPLHSLPSQDHPEPPKPTKPGNIFIQPATGKRFPLRVDPKSYNLPELKDQIAKKINRPPRKFRIVNDTTGEPLDDKTIPDPGTTFHIQDMPDPDPITVKLLNGRTFQLMIDPDENIQDLKQKAANRTGYPVDNLCLLDPTGEEPADNVKPTPGTTYHVAPPQIQLDCQGSEPTTIDILPKDTIGDIQDKISSILGIPKNKTRNFFVDGEKPLDVDDDTPALQTILQHGTTLHYDNTPEDNTNNQKFPKSRQFRVDVEPPEQINDGTNKPQQLSSLPVQSFSASDDEDESRSDHDPNSRQIPMDVQPPEKIKDGPKRPRQLSSLPLQSFSASDDEDENHSDEDPSSRQFHVSVEPPEQTKDGPKRPRQLSSLPVQSFPASDNEDESDEDPNSRQFHVSVEPPKTNNDGPKRPRQLSSLPVQSFPASDNEDESHSDSDQHPSSRQFHVCVEPPETVNDGTKRLGQLSGLPIQSFPSSDDEDEESYSDEEPQQQHMVQSHSEMQDIEKTQKVDLHQANRIMEDVDDVSVEEIRTNKSRNIVLGVDSPSTDHDNNHTNKVNLLYGSPIPDNQPADIVSDNTAKLRNGRTFNLVIDPERATNGRDNANVDLTLFPVRQSIDVDDEEEEYQDQDQRKPRHADDIETSDRKVSLLTTDVRRFEDMEGNIDDDDSVVRNSRGKDRLFFMDSDRLEDPGGKAVKADLEINPVHNISELEGKTSTGRSMVMFEDPSNSTDTSSARSKDRLVLDPIRNNPGIPDPLSILVRSPGGRTYNVFFDPEDKVCTIRDKVKRQVLSMPGFKLFDLDGMEMDDEQLLSSYNIRPGEVILLEPTQKVTDLHKNKKIQLSVLPTTDISDIPDVDVDDNKRYPKSRERVFFLDEEEHLDFAHAAHAIKMQGVPKTETNPLHETIPDIVFRSRDGRNFHVAIEPEDTVKTVKAKLHAKVGFGVGGFLLDDLDFDDADDDILFLDLKPSARNGAVLVTEPPPQKIESLNSKKRIKSSILPTVSFEDDPQEVVEESVLGKKSSQQRVFFMDNDERSKRNPSSRKIEFEKGVSVESDRFQLAVEHWNGRRFMITVDPTEFIVDVKGKIFEATKVPVEQQNLTWNGAPPREDLNLKEQNINQTSTLMLEPMMIHVIDPDGTRHRLTVRITDQIISIKDQLSRKTKIPAEFQCIVSGNTEFFNAMSLEECEIVNGDELNLEIFRVYVADWDGKQWLITGLKPSDNLSVLKTKVHEVTNVPIHLQKLMAEGRYLGDHGTLSLLGVKHRMMIILEDPRRMDLQVQDRETLSLHIQKPKQFKTNDSEIWPVVPDWRRRIFFFDHETTLDDDFVELTVMLWTGENIILDSVRLGQRVGDLKERVQQLAVTKIPMDKFDVSFHGKKLDPERSLRQQMVTHKAVLVVEGKRTEKIVLPNADRISVGILPTKIISTMRINVRHWLGNEFSIDVDPTYYLDDIKEKIQMLSNIPIEQQRLLYEGKSLNDAEIISKQGMVSGCTILLEQMRICISLPGNDELLLYVEPSDTICDVKTIIFEKTGMIVESQCIMFGGEELLDAKTLEECDVGHDDHLQLEEFKLLIVDSVGESFRLSGISPSNTIDQVKGKIFRLKHIPQVKQKLYYHGKLLEGNKSLREEVVPHKSVFILEVDSDDNTLDVPRTKVSFMTDLPKTSNKLKAHYAINIKHWNGVDIFTIEADPAEYADDVREKIQRKHRIPVERQVFSFHGVPLRDDLNLEQQNVQDGSTLTLEPMNIFIDMPDGSRTSLKVEPEYTISQVKECLFDNGSKCVDGQCLMLGGQELQDGMSLDYYQIKHDEILVVDKFMVMVMDASGKSIDISNLTLQSMVADVKKGIKAARSLPPEKQRLSYQGVLLNDSNTLADQGIHHKSVIILEEVSAETAFPTTEKIRLDTFPAGDRVRNICATKLNDSQQQENDFSESSDIEEENPLKAVNGSNKSGGSATSTILEAKPDERSKWWENVAKKAVAAPQANSKSKKIKFERQKKKENDDEGTSNKIMNASDDDKSKKQPKKHQEDRTTEVMSNEGKKDKSSPNKRTKSLDQAPLHDASKKKKSVSSKVRKQKS